VTFAESSVQPRPGLPRAAEALIAAIGLVVVSPLLAVAALAIVVESPGPAFFRQERVGREGCRFRLRKLRTMRAGEGPEVTEGGDERITRVGRLLRRHKIDELPQLWNVLLGDMSFVGPRPEVPTLVDESNDLWKRVLAVRPGITDPVTLALRDEEALLAKVGGDHEVFYREVLQPFKLRGYLDYLGKRTILSDVGVILRTILSAVRVLRIPAVTLAQVEKERAPGSTSGTAAEGEAATTIPQETGKQGDSTWSEDSAG
jgi:lipopolysaccharide/colanic/teichoic acid biosynthesis glycosyltransferase